MPAALIMVLKTSKSSETSDSEPIIAAESVGYVTTERIRAYRQRYHSADDPPVAADENIEMHDSALFDPPVVEVDFYDGRRLRIPQTSTPPGWEAPF